MRSKQNRPSNQYDDYLDKLVRWARDAQPMYTRNPSDPIPNIMPHYTDDRFRNAQTVYLASGHKLTGDTVKGANYNYSDRLWEWDWNKSEVAFEEAKTKYVPKTANFYEAYLQAYTGDKGLKLVHVMAGFNVSNGYPYQEFGYIVAPAEGE